MLMICVLCMYYNDGYKSYYWCMLFVFIFIIEINMILNGSIWLNGCFV